MELTRSSAITILAALQYQYLTVDQREDTLLSDWWCLDETDDEFHDLPEQVQFAILHEETPSDPANPIYNSMMQTSLEAEYRGVKNSYIARKLAEAGYENARIIEEAESLLTCPCCHYKTLTIRGEYDVCPVCFWEDTENTDLDRYSGPNHMSLSEGRAKLPGSAHAAKIACPLLIKMDISNMRSWKRRASLPNKTSRRHWRLFAMFYVTMAIRLIPLLLATNPRKLFIL